MLLQVTAFLPMLSLALSSTLSPNKPAFCHDLDCPHFSVLESTADYELRHYEETKWVSIEKEGATRDSVSTDLFMALFHYISGENADHVKIAMTAPVVTTVAHGPGPNCGSNFTMHFMLPHDHWQSPIQPTNPKVQIVTLPAMDVYVKTFSGWAKDQDYTDKVVELHKTLSAANLKVDSTEFYEASYEGPYQFADRHNEVWLRKLM